MLDHLTAAEIFEWWTLYKDEPWGEHRADVRTIAGLAAGVGSRDVRLIWPYWEDPLTPDELQAEIDALEDAEREARNRVHRRQNQHSD